MKKVLTLLVTVLPGAALAHGAHKPIAEPLHTLSHSGHILGAIIIVVALIAFYRQRDES
jgi:hypothetical protein